jgi:hypothetical protein
MNQYSGWAADVVAGEAARRADAGTIRLTGRDVAGLLLCGEMYGAPYDLLAAALQVRPARHRLPLACGFGT